MMAAVWALFSGSPFARTIAGYVVAGGPVIVGVVAIYETGVHAERKRGEAAGLRILIAAQQARVGELERQAAARDRIITDFETLKTQDGSRLASLEERTRAYEAALAKGRGDTACRIDARDGMR